MKRLIIFISMALCSLILASCGTADVAEKENYIITVSELSGCTITTRYIFDDDMELDEVIQTAKYTDASRMSLEYAIVEADVENFTDVVKDGNSFSCELTDDGIDQFYPNATYDSILEMANEQELSVETSK